MSHALVSLFYSQFNSCWRDKIQLPGRKRVVWRAAAVFKRPPPLVTFHISQRERNRTWEKQNINGQTGTFLHLYTSGFLQNLKTFCALMTSQNNSMMSQKARESGHAQTSFPGPLIFPPSRSSLQGRERKDERSAFFFLLFFISNILFLISHFDRVTIFNAFAGSRAIFWLV